MRTLFEKLKTHPFPFDAHFRSETASPKEKIKVSETTHHPSIITRGPRARRRTEQQGDLIVDHLPMPIRFSPKYPKRPINSVEYVPLDILRSEPRFDNFETISQVLYRSRSKVVITKMYHWTEGEDLRLEDLTKGRLYFSYDPSHWSGDTPRGQALFRISCEFHRPATLLNQTQPYEWSWERIENKLDQHQIPRDALFYSCMKPHIEAPLGFVYCAKQSVFHVEYVGTAGYSF